MYRRRVDERVDGGHVGVNETQGFKAHPGSHKRREMFVEQRH